MSIDMLNMLGGTAPARPSPPPSAPGRNETGSGKARGDFAGMMEARTGSATPPPAQAPRGKVAKKDALRPETGKETPSVPARGKPKPGSGQGTDKATATAHRKQKAPDADATDAQAGVETAAAAAIAAPVPPAPVIVTATPIEAAAEAEVEAEPIARPVGLDAPVGSGAPVGPAAKSFLMTESVSEFLPDADGKPVPAGNAAASVPQPGSAPEEDAALSGRAPQPVPARAGEATELLDIVKTELPGKAPAEQPGAVQGEPVEPAPASGAKAIRAAARAVPEEARSQPPGLAVAAEHASDEAQPVLVRVADGFAARQAGTPAAPAREPAGATMQSSGSAERSMAAAVAGSAEKASDRRDEGDKGAAPLSAVPAGRGDARAPDLAVPPAASGNPVADLAAAGLSGTAGAPVQGAVLPPVSLGASLGQQVIDLGISGQWIDDIARQIASIAANPGHGSFQIASQGLGTVRIDIAPGQAGTRVHMTVDNEAAQAALVKDQARLVQDAQLASMRIGEVRIDRVAPAADTQRGDMGQGGQNAGSHGQQGAQASSGQNGGQGGQSGSRQDGLAFAAGNSGGNGPKSSFTRAVINDAVAAESVTSSPRNGKADTARYA